jgi:hypothetical protein
MNWDEYLRACYSGMHIFCSTETKIAGVYSGLRAISKDELFGFLIVRYEWRA